MENSYHFTIGDIQCWAINDGPLSIGAEVLFSNAPAQELSRALQRHNLDPEHMPGTLTHLLVKTAGHLILVDTGHGLSSDARGQLVPNMQQAGIQPDDIDIVILTHVHPDHVDGCVDEAGELTFTRAAYYMLQDEWAFWTSETNLQQVPPWAADCARRSLPALDGRIILVDEEIEIVPGVTIVPAVGHTPGHCVVQVSSGGQTLLAIIDAALHPLHIEFPHWNALLDLDHEQTTATRQALYQRAAESEALVLAFHFPPFPSLGHITRHNDKWQWTPIEAS